MSKFWSAQISLQKYFGRGLTKQLINSLQNKSLLKTRSDLQAKIDAWFETNSFSKTSLETYEAFLRKIGYIHDDKEDFEIETDNVDPEIALIAGPQLVVPITNARYALNAANARWGSLYDALYGTDVISAEGGAELIAGKYNPIRGSKVISFARNFLNDSVPLKEGNWHSIIKLAVKKRATSY